MRRHLPIVSKSYTCAIVRVYIHIYTSYIIYIYTLYTCMYIPVLSKSYTCAIVTVYIQIIRTYNIGIVSGYVYKDVCITRMEYITRVSL